MKSITNEGQVIALWKVSSSVKTLYKAILISIRTQIQKISYSAYKTCGWNPKHIFEICVLIDIRIALHNVFTELDTFQSAITWPSLVIDFMGLYLAC